MFRDLDRMPAHAGFGYERVGGDVRPFGRRASSIALVSRVVRIVVRAARVGGAWADPAVIIATFKIFMLTPGPTEMHHGFTEEDRSHFYMYNHVCCEV